MIKKSKPKPDLANRFIAPVYVQARAELAREIDEVGAHLIALQEAYEAMGGTYEDEEAPASAPKLLTGPKGSTRVLRGPRRSGDEDLAFTGKQEDVYRLLTVSADGIAKIDDIAGVYGGMKQRWYNDQEDFKRKLKAQHGKTIVNIRGLGYRLEDL